MFDVLVELVLGNSGGTLRAKFNIPQYVIRNLGRLNDLCTGIDELMPCTHGGDAPEDGAHEYQVIAYGEMGDQLSLLNRKPELYFLSLFLNDVFQGNLNVVFIMQRDANGRLFDD